MRHEGGVRWRVKETRGRPASVSLRHEHRQGNGAEGLDPVAADVQLPAEELRPAYTAHVLTGDALGGESRSLGICLNVRNSVGEEEGYDGVYASELFGSGIGVSLLASEDERAR